MGRLFNKREDNLLLGTAKETLGFSKELNSVIQDFLIKIYDFYSLEQIEDIKRQLMSRKILIINVKKIFENSTIQILDLKRVIDKLKLFLRENGGSLGRIGDQYLILTPNSHIKIAN